MSSPAVLTGASSATGSWMAPSSPGAGASKSSSTELDERVVAKAALDAAEDALESLCAQHAGTFVAVEKRGQELQESLRQLSTTIQAVQSHTVPAAQRAVERAQAEDETTTNNDEEAAIHSLALLSEKHRVRRRTLLQHSALLELLELPSLMDACVRSNLYEDALSIAGLANALAAAQQGHNKVVAHVVTQIRNRQDDLRRHLLHRLEGAVTMPDCLEVVTALRRLNSIDLERQSTTATAGDSERLYRGMEVQLQIDFLEARNVWLDSTSSSSSTTTASGSSTKYGATATTTASTTTATTSTASEDMLDTIERYRTRVFEIATQFNAIFRAHGGSTEEHEEEHNLLALWTCRRLHAFVQVLQQGLHDAAAAAQPTAGPAAASTSAALPQFGAATLRDWLEAALFFASSMGRLGADFTAYQIPTLFEDALHDWIVHALWLPQGVKPLVDTWHVCLQANVATPLLVSSSSSSSSSHHSSKTSNSSSAVAWSLGTAAEVRQAFCDFVVPASAAALTQPLPPLRIWMQVPPLGRLVNAILYGLNELRRCLLPSALPRLHHALETLVLEPVALQLKQVERQVVTTPGTLPLLRLVIQTEYVPLWHSTVVPYLRASLAMARGGPTTETAWQHYQQCRQAIDKVIDDLQAKEDAAVAAAERQKQEEEAAAAAAAAEAEEEERRQSEEAEAAAAAPPEDDEDAGDDNVEAPSGDGD